MDRIFPLDAEPLPPTRAGIPIRYRPTARCIAHRFTVAGLVVCAGAFCLKYCLTLGFNLRAIANGVIVLLGLCHILDALVARLSVDEDAIEIRTLMGVDILWRTASPKGSGKLESEIQRWRNTLSLHLEEIARVHKKEMMHWVGFWIYTILYGPYAIWRLVSLTEWPTGAMIASLMILPFLVSLGLWCYGMSIFASARPTPRVPPSIPGVIGYRTSVRIAFFLVVAAFANTGIALKLPNGGEAFMLVWEVAVVFYLAWGFLLWKTHGSNLALTWSSVALLLYTFGAVLLANAALDHSQPVAERVVVMRKHTETHFSRGNASWSHHLDLRPWSAQPHGSTIEVSRPLYNSIRAGDSVCFDLRQGRLGVSWYERLVKCAAKAP